MGQWLLPKIEGLGPGGRGGHTCVLVGTQVVLFGGSDRAPVTYDDLWVLETGNGVEGLEWTRITPTFNAGCQIHPRSGASLTAIGNLVYLFGGQEPVTEFRFGDLKVLDTTTWTWSDVEVTTKNAPPARHSHTATCLSNQCLLLFGGSGYSGSMSDIWVFNPQQSAWQCPSVGGAAPAAREMHCAAMVTPTRMVVYGGRGADGSVLCDAAVFDANDMRWEACEPTPFPRCAHCCGALHTTTTAEQPQSQPDQPEEGASTSGSPDLPSMVVYGGFSGEAVEGDVMRIDAKSLEVEVLHRGPRQSDSKGSVPTARFAASAVALPHWKTGPALCIIGGVSAEEDLSDVVMWVM